MRTDAHVRRSPRKGKRGVDLISDRLPRRSALARRAEHRQYFISAHVFAQPNRASCVSASVTAQDDSYTRVTR